MVDEFLEFSQPPRWHLAVTAFDDSFLDVVSTAPDGAKRFITVPVSGAAVQIRTMLDKRSKIGKSACIRAAQEAFSSFAAWRLRWQVSCGLLLVATGIRDVLAVDAAGASFQAGDAVAILAGAATAIGDLRRADAR